MKKFMLVCLLLVSLLAVFSAKAATDTVPSQCSQTLHNFSFKKNATSSIHFNTLDDKVKDSTIIFEFVEEQDVLYATYNIDLEQWNYCTDEKPNELAVVVRLYDAGKNLLNEEKLSCLKKIHTLSGFGPFSKKINHQNIGKVKYFSLAAISCSTKKEEKEKKEKTLYLKDNPELRPLFKNVKKISNIIFSCIPEGKWKKLECTCSKKDKLKIPVRNAGSFLEKHPELKGKMLSFFEQKKAGESISSGFILDGIPELQNQLKSCK